MCTTQNIATVFVNNYVIVEGSGAAALNNRGLLSLIRAKSVEFIPEDIGYHSYEESSDESTIIDGVRRLRGSARTGVGSFAK